MKKRLILKVLGLLLLLPMFSGCNDTDDVAGIFTGKTWKLTYITKANGHGWYKFADVGMIVTSWNMQMERKLSCWFFPVL